LDDEHRDVASAAACALGRMGRPEARAPLVALLRARPSREVIEAIEPIADEACLVLLGRVARTVPALAACAMDVLASCEHPRAAAVIRAIGHTTP
jgi:HEAT repeat protein